MKNSTVDEEVQLPPHVVDLLESCDRYCDFIKNEALDLLRNTEIAVFNGLRNLSSQECLKVLDRISAKYLAEDDLVEYVVGLAVLTEYVCTAYRNTHLYETFHVALSKSFKHILFEKLCLEWLKVYKSENLSNIFETAEFKSSFNLFKYSVDRFPASFTYKYKLRETIRQGEVIISMFQQQKSSMDHSRLHVGSFNTDFNSSKSVVGKKLNVPRQGEEIISKFQLQKSSIDQRIVVRLNTGSNFSKSFVQEKLNVPVKSLGQSSFALSVPRSIPREEKTLSGAGIQDLQPNKIGAFLTSKASGISHVKIGYTPSNAIFSKSVVRETLNDPIDKAIKTVFIDDLNKSHCFPTSSPKMFTITSRNPTSVPKNSLNDQPTVIVDLTKQEEVLEPSRKIIRLEPPKKVVRNAFDILMRKKSASKTHTATKPLAM